MATRVAILADTHLREPSGLPAQVADLIRGADLAIHAGDMSTVKTLEGLKALGTPLRAVCGNVDEPAVAARLPEELIIAVEQVAFAVIHDSGPSKGRLDRLRAGFPRADVVVFGHSHMPLHETEDGFHIFNPGSPTQRRRAPHHTMGIAEVGGRSVELELITLDPYQERGSPQRRR